MRSLYQIALSFLFLALAQPLAAAEPKPLVQVWKSPTCGCCNVWVDHLKKAGFQVETNDTGNAAIRARLGVAQQFGACHTARVGNYVVEGHVPAADILRLIREKPEALGIAVPGMPIGSPGMDGPQFGNRKQPYDVLLLKSDGSASVFASH